MNKINTELAINIMNLSEQSLIKINELIKETLDSYEKNNSNIKMYLKAGFNVDEFINYCKIELKLDNNLKPEKGHNNIYYKLILKKYKDLLKEILSNDKLFNFLYYNILKNKNYNQREYLNFLDYICENYHKKEIILNNLSKMKELGINEFSFEPEKVFAGKQTIIIQENKLTEDHKEYCVRGFYTDTEKKYFSHPEEDVYVFTVGIPKFKIEYIKGSLLHDKIIMEVNRLDFNTNSLPTIEELTDPRLLPNIEFDYIKRKKEAINFNYATTMSLESAKDLLIYSKYLLQQLETIGLTKEYTSIKSQLEMIQKFIDNLSQIQKEQLERYINDGIVTRTELYNLTETKIKSGNNKKNLIRSKH